jgi:hypothetical protein
MGSEEALISDSDAPASSTTFAGAARGVQVIEVNFFLKEY